MKSPRYWGRMRLSRPVSSVFLLGDMIRLVALSLMGELYDHWGGLRRYGRIAVQLGKEERGER